MTSMTNIYKVTWGRRVEDDRITIKNADESFPYLEFPTAYTNINMTSSSFSHMQKAIVIVCVLLMVYQRFMNESTSQLLFLKAFLLY